jgi:16S rRNA (uracil1498-N3)-methyltransferase
MPIERYFTPLLFQPNDLIELRGVEFHHLLHVMRGQKGKKIEVVNGLGVLAAATISEIKKDSALLHIESCEKEISREYKLVLAQAFPKMNRLETVIEKGTELGVDEFWLFPGLLSIKKEIPANQLERLHAIAIAAMKQCGRYTLPSITIHPPIVKWQSVPGVAFFGDTSLQAELLGKYLQKNGKREGIYLFATGPESGFSLQEEEKFKQLDMIGIRLHPYILRTDTASLMAVSVLNHWLDCKM